MKCQIFKDVAYILKGFKKGDVSDLELNLITNIYMAHYAVGMAQPNFFVWDF